MLLSLSLSPQYWGYKHIVPCPAFYMVLGIRIQVLMLAQHLLFQLSCLLAPLTLKHSDISFVVISWNRISLFPWNHCEPSMTLPPQQFSCLSILSVRNTEVSHPYTTVSSSLHHSSLGSQFQKFPDNIFILLLLYSWAQIFLIHRQMLNQKELLIFCHKESKKRNGMWKGQF